MSMPSLSQGMRHDESSRRWVPLRKVPHMHVSPCVKPAIRYPRTKQYRTHAALVSGEISSVMSSSKGRWCG